MDDGVKTPNKEEEKKEEEKKKVVEEKKDAKLQSIEQRVRDSQKEVKTTRSVLLPESEVSFMVRHDPSGTVYFGNRKKDTLYILKQGSVYALTQTIQFPAAVA